MFTKMFTGPLREVFQVAFVCAIFFRSFGPLQHCEARNNQVPNLLRGDFRIAQLLAVENQTYNWKFQLVSVLLQ